MAYRDQGPYGQSRQDQGNPYGQQHYEDVERGQGFQMSDMNGRGGYSQQDPNYMLDLCSNLEKDIDRLDLDRQNLERLQDAVVNGTDTTEKSQSLQNLRRVFNDSANTQHALMDRMKKIKLDPRADEPRNKPTVERVLRRLNEVGHNYRVSNTRYEGRELEKLVRNYKTIYPNATDAEARAACENLSDDQLFSQAVMTTNRSGASSLALAHVEARHQTLQQMLRGMMELLAAYQELNALVRQQEPVVTQINEQSEVVHQNVDQANHQLDGAVKSAKAANRKKWYCLGIAALIIIIIIIIVVIVVKVVLNK